MPFWYVPRPHGVHDVAAALETKPALHSVQVPFRFTNVPGGHRLQPRLPWVWILPATASHGLHSVCPASFWNSPGPHALQPVAPPDPRFALLPGRHLAQKPALALECKPASHIVLIPAEHWYPASHSMHALLSSLA